MVIYIARGLGRGLERAAQKASRLHSTKALAVRTKCESGTHGPSQAVTAFAIAGFRDFCLRGSCIVVCRSFKDESATFHYTIGL